MFFCYIAGYILYDTMLNATYQKTSCHHDDDTTPIRRLRIKRRNLVNDLLEGQALFAGKKKISNRCSVCISRRANSPLASR